MLKNGFKVLVLSALLFAFIGQAMGYSKFNSCQETALAETATLNDGENITPNNTDKALDDCCNDDCCDNECACIANGYLTVMYLTTELKSLKTIWFNESVYIQYLAQPTSISVSFYRPPIFIS